MKQNLLFYIFISLLLFVCLRIYYESDAFQLKCVIATKDGNRYCVRDRNKLELAAELLATVAEKSTTLIAHLENKYPKDERVKRLVQNFNATRISETLPTSELTAYSENKGEKIAFCLNSEKNNDNNLIDINTLFFVCLHELSHIMTLSQGHKQEFWINFKFLIENAKEIGSYEVIDYKKTPVEYCGMTIHDSPYFDLV